MWRKAGSATRDTTSPCSSTSERSLSSAVVPSVHDEMSTAIAVVLEAVKPARIGAAEHRSTEAREATVGACHPACEQSVRGRRTGGAARRRTVVRQPQVGGGDHRADFGRRAAVDVDVQDLHDRAVDDLRQVHAGLELRGTAPLRDAAVGAVRLQVVADVAVDVHRDRVAL
eukprot:6224384-Prymnesium_polylepis.1